MQEGMKMKTIKQAIEDYDISEIACMGCGSTTRKIYVINEGTYAGHWLCATCLRAGHLEVLE